MNISKRQVKFDLGFKLSCLHEHINEERYFCLLEDSIELRALVNYFFFKGLLSEEDQKYYLDYSWKYYFLAREKTF